MGRVFTWNPPTGDPITLNDAGAGYRLMQSGTRGLSAPPYRVSDETYAGLDGTTLLALAADRRDITLALQVEGADAAEFRSRWRALIRAFRPKAGDGVLSVSDEWGTTRTLICRYVGGFEGDGDAEFAGTIGRAAVKLSAFNPWWLGGQQTLQFGLGAPTAFFPIFPLVLSPSTVQGQFTVDLSDADDGAFPVWTIVGPGSGLVLTNSTTNRSLTVNASLASGETMVIDTRPDYQSVRRGDGTNLLGSVDGYPDLWPLISGINNVTANLIGATANSQIQGAWQPRHAGL